MNHNIAKDELLRLLKMKADELGRVPTTAEIEADPRLPTRMTYTYHFGSYKEAARLIGFDNINRCSNNPYSDEELLDLLRNKAADLGRTPRAIDLENDSSMPSPYTYKGHFGSLVNALRKIGLEPKPSNRGRFIPDRGDCYIDCHEDVEHSIQRVCNMGHCQGGTDYVS